MPISARKVLAGLPAKRRRKIESRAAQLLEDEMTLRELRRARKLTQVKLARTLGVAQDSISRMEQRTDMLLSSLRKTIEAMGGELSLVAKFPDHAPILLKGIAAADEPDRDHDTIASATNTRHRTKSARG